MTEFKSISKRSLSEVISTLDVASRPSTSSSSSSSPPSKRRSIAPKSSTPALESLLSLSSSVSAPPPATYNPLSLAGLLSRLSTFRLSTFSPKPPSLSPLQFALHGWSNAAPPRERVACSTCQNALLVLGPSEGKSWDSPVGASLRAVYELKLRDGHDVACPWRLRPCSAGLYVLPGVSRSHLVQTPTMDKPPRLEHPLAKETVDGLLPTTPLRPEMVLALFNWSLVGDGVSEEGERQTVACSHCARTAYLPAPDSEASFDVLRQHKDFCAVVNGGWESRVAALAGGHGHGGGAAARKTEVKVGDAVDYVRSVLGPRGRKSR